MRRARGGFTLIEALIAMVLSSLVIILVSHAFFVQNRFYSTQTLRSSAQDNVRAATELVAREVRTAMEEGVVVAGARTLTIRSPLAMTVVCSLDLPDADVYNDGGEPALDTDEVAGVAHRDPSTGDWDAINATWVTLNGTTSDPAGNCAANGADTMGAYGSFHRLLGLGTRFASTPANGDVVMVFRETTFKIQDSALEPGTLGIFRAAYGGSLVEFATGVDTTAQFQYRSGGSYVDTVTAGSLASIDAVRIVADARKRAPTGGVDDIRFGWSVNVPLRTMR